LREDHRLFELVPLLASFHIVGVGLATFGADTDHILIATVNDLNVVFSPVGSDTLEGLVHLLQRVFHPEDWVLAVSLE